MKFHSTVLKGLSLAVAVLMFSVPQSWADDASAGVLAPITITASPQPKSAWNSPASVSVVEGRKMDRQQGESVMSAIQNQPGVNMIGEGPTVVKPVIRGLNSQDIVVVEDGIRSENLQWGNEHAPEIDPLGTDRIEVMRGANSLLYGSDALGGVISITHPDLPNAHLGDTPLSGRFSTLVNSNNNSVGENFEASGAAGDWGYRTNLSQLQGGNFRTPDQGTIPNTGIEEVSGNGAFGVRKDWGGLDFDFGKFNKRVELQNPDDPASFNDLEYQTLEHDHGKVHSNIITAPASIDITAGYDWANRREFDGPSAPDNDPVLHWTEASYTLDAKARLSPLGPFEGTVGVSGVRRVEQSLGITHLTPGYNENGLGEYWVEDLTLGKFNFTAGVRGDQDQYNIGGDDQIGINPDSGLDDPHPVAAQTLKYSAVSAAAGGVYHITDPLAFTVNVGRGYRNPVPFELFAFGEHEGAGVFQIGNPNLSPETSINTEASLRWSSARVKAEVGIFRNYIHNYIYGAYLQNPDGSQIVEPTSGAPEVQETQGNATVKGVDGAIAVAATDWLTLNSVYNMVRGYNNVGDPMANTNYLPHVPADNVLVGADFHVKSLGPVSHPYIGIDEKFTMAQSRTNASEIPTDTYALMGLHAGGEVVILNNRVTLDAGVTNLLNKGYIDYNSILKEFGIENPGRNVYAKLSIPFGK